MRTTLGFILASTLATTSFATERVYNLTVDYKNVNFTGRSAQALVVNNQIPAPTLHFKQGDDVTINVTNQLNEETAIHWHGLLVPWQMDGVLGITQRGIQPGQTFQYHFKLMQSGTYWYHAHAGLQEQRGMYGAFVVDPLTPPPYHYNKDYVVVLSDWSNTLPDKILANLKKDGDYYSPLFPLQPSLMKFIHDYRKANTVERRNLIADYKMMQQMRMSLYDINDVAYDAFLLNGQPRSTPWTGSVKVGDTVRLRFIGAGAETIFHVKMPGASMQVVQIDGNDVNPYNIDDFTISPGETYDVLVKIKQDNPQVIYAESLDTVGAAYGALITRPGQSVNYKAISAFPEPPPVTREMMANMMQEPVHGSAKRTPHEKQTSNMHMHHDMSMNMDMDMPMAMNHASMHSAKKPVTKSAHSMPMDMAMPTEPSIIGDKPAPYIDSTDNLLSTGTKYQDLSAKVLTNNPDKPVTETIKMELFGYMNHFIWMVNGKNEHQVAPLILKPNKRYRIIFSNNSMMRHPMHIHGHWFILRNGHGAYDPLLHTIEVAPGSTVVADIDTDASGQWLFHCHMIYHMTSGMARVFQYSTLIEITKDEAKPQDIVKNTQYINRPIVRVDEVRPIDQAMIHHPMAHQTGLWLATYLDLATDPFHNIQHLTYKGLYGPDIDKLELLASDAKITKGTVDDADLDIFYWHLISQFWAVKGGINYFYRPATMPYWHPGIGIEGLMPYFIDTDIRSYYYSGSAKLDVDLSRDTQITNNIFIRLGISSVLATKTVTNAGIGSNLNKMNYLIRPYYRLIPGLNVFAEYEYEKDYGAYKTIQSNAHGVTSQNTVSFGLTALI